MEIQANPPKLASPGAVTLSITITNQSATNTIYNIAFMRDGTSILDVGSLSPKAATVYTKQIMIGASDLQRSIPIYYTWLEGFNNTSAVQHSGLEELLIYMDDSATDFELTRSITPTVVTPSTPITAEYTLINKGGTTLKNVIITDPELNLDWRIPVFPPNDYQTRQIAPFTTNIELESRPVMQYMVEGDPTPRTSTLDPLLIELSKPGILLFNVVATPAIVIAGGNTTLLISVQNDGLLPLRDIRIVCDELSEEFPEIPVLSSGFKSFDRKVIALSTKNYHFKVTARDADGKEIEPLVYTLQIPVVGAVDRPVNLSVEATASVAQLSAPGDVDINVTLKNNDEAALYDIRITDPKFGEIGTLEQLPAHTSRLIIKTLRIEETSELNLSVSAHLKDTPPITVNAETLRIPIRQASAATNTGRRATAAASSSPSAIEVTAPPPVPAGLQGGDGHGAASLLSPQPSATATPYAGIDGTPSINAPIVGISERTISWLKWGLVLLGAMVILCVVVLIVIWRRYRRAKRYR